MKAYINGSKQEVGSVDPVTGIITSQDGFNIIGVCVGYSEDGYPIAQVSGALTDVHLPEPKKGTLLKGLWKRVKGVMTR